MQPATTDHDAELVRHVAPPDWANPTPQERYHLVVIGAGTAGLVTASIAATLGARVALVERHRMGGDCLNYGCVPSKALLRAARAHAEARHAAARFGGPAVSGPGDFGRVMERMRRLRASIAPHDGAARFRDLGVDVFLGSARFAGRDAIAVGDRVLRFRRAVVATGARAFVPPIPGLEDVDPLTNETIFSLDELPARLAVVGAGPIGMEMAQAFARFGSRVTVVDRAEQVLPREDADAAAIVRAALERDGVSFLLGAAVVRAERRGAAKVLHVEAAGRREELAADAVLVAVGRAPNVDGLGLDDAGIAFDRGGIEVDRRMRTTNRRVFAIGDVASRFKFTHAADAQARLVAANALFGARARADRLVMPWSTYTSPELAHTGLSARDAAARGIAMDTITVPLAENDRAVLDGESEGFVRIHLAQGRDRILGATIVAEHAGEMISELTTAIVNRIGLLALGRAIRPYPTVSEAIRRAADQHRRGALTPTRRRLLGWYFRLVSRSSARTRP
ncbi:MAG: mercuric reductase [Acidobacteria bacterium]|nr:MAG: mercuric reductase [Acidobacteriota bacterium]